jgi:hypothetical protein
MTEAERSAKLTGRFVTVSKALRDCLSTLLHDEAPFALMRQCHTRFIEFSGGSRGNAMTTRGVMRKRLLVVVRSGGADRCRCRSGTAASR